MQPVTLLCAGFFCFNIAAFAVAMGRHFRRPVGTHRGISLIMTLGPVSAVSTLLAYGLVGVQTPANGAMAISLYAVSGMLFFWAIHASGRGALPFAFSADTPVDVVQTGPYAFIRHPFYASYALTWLAGAVAIPAFHFTLIPPVVMLPLYWTAASEEESTLASSPVLGDAYRTYQQRTGRFLPRLTR